MTRASASRGIRMTRKNHWIVWAVLLFFTLLCKPSNALNEPGGDPGKETGPTEFELLNQYATSPSFFSALFAVITAKRGELEPHPFVEVDPEAKIRVKHDSDLSGFMLNSAVITDYHRQPGDPVFMGVVTEFIDPWGRRDLAANQIVYRIQEPETQEAITPSFLQERLKALSYDPGSPAPEWSEPSRSALARFQEDHGLNPSGQPDLETLKLLVGDAVPVITVLEINSFSLYPSPPKHIAYILPEPRVTEDPSRFGQGFSSWEDVARNAVSPEGLGKDEDSGDFVLFVYFLDKVDPSHPICLKFSSAPLNPESTTPQGEGVPQSPRRYADRGAWPVLSETVRLNARGPSSGLYVNLFVNEAPVACYRLQ